MRVVNLNVNLNVKCIDEASTEFISAIAATETTAVVLTACMNNVKEFVAMFS